MNLSKNKTDGFQKYLTSQKIILTVQAMRRPMYAPARRVSFGAFNHLVDSRLRHSGWWCSCCLGNAFLGHKPVQRLLHPSSQVQTKNPAKLSTSSSLHHSRWCSGGGHSRGDFVFILVKLWNCIHM